MRQRTTHGTAVTRRRLLGTGAATLASLVGATGTAAAGCGTQTLAEDETEDRNCFTESTSLMYRYGEARLYVDGTPNTEWDFGLNNQSDTTDICESPFDQHRTVTSSEAVIDFTPEDELGIVVDKNGDDLTYDLELYLCA
jgi:hypothetical protein